MPVGRDTSPPTVLSVRGLVKRYHAGLDGCGAMVEAVQGVDFEAGTGEAIGILGPAGAGKSTLMLCVAGLLRPDAGIVSWFGRAADDGGRPPGIVYVPERAPHYAFMTVVEAVEYHALMRDVGGDRARTTGSIAAAIEAVGLTAVSNTRIGELPWSIGPRLSLAQALVGEPRLLLLDETLAALDARARRDIGVMLASRMERGMTVIATADRLDGLDGIATRVAVMIDGRVTTPVDLALLQRPRLIELGIATPALARRILGARVAEEAWDRHLLRLPLEGTTAEAILARVSACGIRVESSRIIVPGEDE